MQWWQWSSQISHPLCLQSDTALDSRKPGLLVSRRSFICPVPFGAYAGWLPSVSRTSFFASLCPSVQMWVLRLKFQWHKRHRLSVQDSCSTASPNSAEHFSSRIVAYRSMAEESQQLLFETDSEPGLQATPRPEELQHTLFSWTRQNIIDSQVLARTAECSHSVWLALCYICEDQCHVEINRNIMLHLDMQAPCRQTWCLCACPYVLCLFVCV